MDDLIVGAIVQLSDYRARRVLPDHDARMERGREIIREAITRTIIEDYASLPIVTVSLAIAEAGRALDENGTFADAVEASAIVLRRAMVEAVGVGRIRPLLFEVAYLKAVRFKVVAAVLRERWVRDHRAPEDYHYALCRARRATRGGGCIDVALYQALGDDCAGGAT
jgi:hypothetical protein